MSFLKAIFGFVIDLLAKLIPPLAKEGKKPQEVKPVGYDKDLQDAIDDDIANAALRTVIYKCSSCGYAITDKAENPLTTVCPHCQEWTLKAEKD